MAIYFAGFIPSEQGYAVLFPDVPGCNTEGETLQEAFSMAMDALSSLLEWMADSGDVIPSPSNRTEATRKFHEQFARLDMGPIPDGTMLYPVPVPDLDVGTVKINVSFSRYNLNMIDRKAKSVGMTRSGFLAAAASAYEV